MPRSTKRRNLRTSKRAIMLASILGILSALKPFLVPLISLVSGWLLPSPLQKTSTDIGKIHDAESKATSTGDTSGLDNLP